MNRLDDRQRHDDADQQADAIATQRIQPVERIGLVDNSADTEHLPEVTTQPGEVGDRKDNPRDHQDNRYNDMGQNFMAAVPIQQPFFLNDQQNKEPQSPQHKVPACTMPQSGQSPDNQQVAGSFSFAAPAAAERKIDVFSEPAGQGYMPSSPEIGDRTGNIRVVEVLRKPETQHITEANRHQRIARKIKINLQGVCQCRNPCHRGGDLFQRQQSRRIPQRANIVCDQYLASQPQDKQRGTSFDHRTGDPAVFQFGRNIRVADNRSRNQLGEQDDVGAEVDDIVLRLDISAVDVDGIAHRLEGIKADAQRQCDRKVRHRYPGDRFDVFEEKPGIFKGKQDPEVQDHRQDQKQFAQFRIVPESLDTLTAGIVDQHGGEHDGKVFYLSPGVENQ